MPEVYEVLLTREPNGTVSIQQVNQQEGKAFCSRCLQWGDVDALHANCGACARCCPCTVCVVCLRLTPPGVSFCSGCASCDEHCVCPHCENCGARVRGQDDICGSCHFGRSCGCCHGTGSVHFRQRAVHLTRFVEPAAVEGRARPARLVACEIEIAKSDPGTAIDKALERWHCSVVRDGSLPSTGYEINTHPANGASFINQIEEIAAALAAQRSMTDGRCGCHTHVDARDFTYHDIGKLIHLYSALEPGIYTALPTTRRESHYCVPSAAKYLNVITAHMSSGTGILTRGRLRRIILQAIYGTTRVGEYRKSKSGGGSCDRYRGLNLHSHLFRGTIEFRFPAGTTRAENMIGWGCILSEIMQMAKHETLDTLRGRTETAHAAILRLKFGEVDVPYPPTTVTGPSQQLLLEIAEQAGVHQWLASEIRRYNT